MIHEGNKKEGKLIGLIGMGTGLGVSYLIPCSNIGE